MSSTKKTSDEVRQQLSKTLVRGQKDQYIVSFLAILTDSQCNVSLG